MMAVMKKPKAKEDHSKAALKKRPAAGTKKTATKKLPAALQKRPAAPNKKAALRQIVMEAIKAGSATPELLAAVRRKWGPDFCPSLDTEGSAAPKKVVGGRKRPEPEHPQTGPKKRKAPGSPASPGKVLKKRPEPEHPESDEVAGPKKRRTGPAGSPGKASARPGEAAGAKKRPPQARAKKPPVSQNGKDEEEDLSGLSKKQQKVKQILKKTIKAQNLSQKERRALRLARRKDGDLVRQLLSQWEELRAGQCSPERRSELCAAMIQASKGKVKELILAHDTSRVFESVMKHGSTEQRLLVIEEIKKDVPQLMKTKFAKFVVKKMLLHGSRDHKVHVFSALEGAVAKMLVHRQAVEILDAAFNDHANAAQRANMVQEVYGAPFSLFKLPGVSKLSEAFAAEPKAKKETVMAHVKGLLTQAIDKGNVKFYIMHYLLLDFLESCSQEDRLEMAQHLKEHIVPLLHTREGVKVAMACLWNTNNKDRKIILKGMKTFIANTAVDEHGYLFILAVLDAVDDIVFLSKTVLKELFEEFEALFASVHGRKVLLYMLDRRNPCYFHPQLLDNVLSKGDSNPHTKKPAEVRSEELRSRCLPPLLRYVAENLPSVCASNGGLMVLREALTFGRALPELFKTLMTALLALMTSGEKVCDGDESLVENTAGHLAMKKVLQKDRDSGNHFSNQLLQLLDGPAVQAITATNRGCFLLVHLCEANDAAVSFLKDSGTLKRYLAKLGFPGAKVLARKLA